MVSRIVSNHELSKFYKSGKISWDEFENKFSNQMDTNDNNGNNGNVKKLEFLGELF